MTTAERILRRCEQAFCLFIVFFWILEGLAGSWWPVAVLICLPHVPAGLPLPLLTYVRLRIAPRRGAWLLLGWLLWLLGSGFHVNRPGAAASWKIATYNLEGCPNGPAATAVALKKLDADIYALQEVQEWPLPGLPAWNTATEGEFAVISRYPIRSHRLVELQPDRFKRPCQVVELELLDGPLRLISVHDSLLVHGPQWLYNQRHQLADIVTQGLNDRDAQMKTLVALASDTRCIIAGDFNAQARDRCLEPLRQNLLDSFAQRGVGWGFTFESTLPAIRIDYIWHSRDMSCKNCRVVPCQASDHFPVVAGFGL